MRFPWNEKGVVHMAKGITTGEAVAQYLVGEPEAFELDRCAEWVAAKMGKNVSASLRSTVKKSLEEDQQLLQLDDGRWLSRRVLFQGARFRILPTADELEQGILFMGHRFVPFRDVAVAPEDYSLLDADGAKAPWSTVEMSFVDARIYFAWLPDVELVATLSDDSPFPEDPEHVMTFRVWDLSAWYNKTGFLQGDSVIVTVKDLGRARYSIERGSREQMQATFGRIRASDVALEEAILGLLDRTWLFGDIETQLFHAYARVDPEVLQHPGQHIGGLLSGNARIEWQRQSGGCVLCRPGEDVMRKLIEQADERFRRTAHRGRLGSIDAILQDLGVSMSETMLKAMMRQEFAETGVVGVEGILDEVTSGGGGTFFFATAAQAAAFQTKVEQLGQRIIRQERKKPTAAAVAQVRNEALRLQFAVLDFLRDLDRRAVEPEQLPTEHMGALMDVQAALDGILDLCERERFAVKDADEMLKTLEEVGPLIVGRTGAVFAELGLEEPEDEGFF